MNSEDLSRIQKKDEEIVKQSKHLNIYDKDNNLVGTMEDRPGVLQSTKVYRKDDGTFTFDPLEISKFYLNEDTGDIVIRAPESLRSLPEFDQIFDPDTIKSYSEAYKSNPAYRVPYTKTNEDGTTEETQITVPEFVNELNSALGSFVENYRVAEKNKENLVKQYGDKANNLSLTQLSLLSASGINATRVHLPNFIFDDNTSFSPLKGMLDSDGTVSKEDFMKYYQLGETSEGELADVITKIDAYLESSDWGEKDIDTTVRAMAMKNFILANDPDAEWHEALGAGAATLALNAAEGFAKVFMNLGTAAEGVVTFGQSHVIQNATENMDKSLSNWNQDRMLIQDSTATLATLGQIGGMIAGTVVEAYIMKKVGGKINSALTVRATEARTALEEAAFITNPAVQSTLDAGTISMLASDIQNISLGAKFMMDVLPVAEKVNMAIMTAQAFLNADTASSFVASFLLDTVHDAIFYDAVTMRHVFEGDSDQNVKNYWAAQLADNAKWWAGMGMARTVLKKAGKTALGQALNVKATQKIQGLTATIGEAKDRVKDNIYGGDVIRWMQDKVKSMADGPKKNYLNNKIEIAEFNKSLRDMRRVLADMDLEWDGFKLTEESLSEFRTKLSYMQAYENAFDLRHSGLVQVRNSLINEIVDPATGKKMYLYPDLGSSNKVALDTYAQLLKYTQDYNLPLAKGSFIAQDIVDYFGGLAENSRLLPIAGGNGPHAKDAQNAIEQIAKNTKAISDRLPDEVKAYLNNPGTIRSYITFYNNLRNFQAKKGLINGDILEAYRHGESTDGYIPIQKEMDVQGTYRRFDNATLRSIEENIDHFTYKVADGQHYVDPEITRQRWLVRTADEVISKDLKKAYDGFFGNSETVLATSGQTERARLAASAEKDLKEATAFASQGITEKFDINATQIKKRKNLKNKTYTDAEKQEVVAAMSLDDTIAVLQKKHALQGGNTKLVDTVNSDNYQEWFDAQSQPVKNYLEDTYEKIVPEGSVYKRVAGEIHDGDEVFGTSRSSFSTMEQEQFFDFSTENPPLGYTSTADYYKKAKNQMADFVYMSPDEYLEALLKKNGGTYDSVEDIVKRSREHVDIVNGRNPLGDGRGWKDYAEDMKNKNFSDFYGGKFPPPYLNYSVEGYRGQEGIHRALAAKEIGIKQMPVVVMHPYENNPKVVEKLLKGKTAVSMDDGSASSAKIVDNNYSLFRQAAQEGGDDFEAGLQRAWLLGDDKFSGQDILGRMIENVNQGKPALGGEKYSILETRSALRNVQYINPDDFIDSVEKSIRIGINDYIGNVLDAPAVKKSINALADGNANGAALSAKYYALKYLTDKKGKKDFLNAIEEEVRNSLKGNKKITANDVDLCVRHAQSMAEQYVWDDFNRTRNALKDINPDLVDSTDLFKETEALADEIDEYRKAAKNPNDNTIMYLNDKGQEVFAKIDPNFASLYKIRHHMSRGEASAFAKFNAATSRLFRYGTTTLNLSSFSNQAFRDTGNALIVGGGWHTIRYCADNLVDTLGANIVEQIKRFDPSGYELKQIQQIAEEAGMTLEQAAVSRELARGAVMSPASTETTLYKNAMRDYREFSSGVVDRMKTKLDNVINKFGEVDEWTNGRREEYLRKRVYANNLNDAIKKGYNLEQARSMAAYAMNNATTNFTRQIYHMQAIADSTPYFKAAINGTKSFWRMWSIDPVGISGRMMGGLFLPVMFLTGASLGDPENREVYKNIPEYQKDENFVFVVDKQIITIPMPQEMSNLVAPFRQFVEYLHGANENDFWELMMNDALGFSPVDLTGFSTIDMDKMISEPNLGDRINRGFARIFSQVAPVPLRSTYMMVTGTDPYTGKNLYDPSYTYWDDDTNSVQTMNENQGSFAKWVAKLWGQESNASVLEKVASGVFGSTGQSALNSLVTLFEEGLGSSASGLAQEAIAQATNPYYANAYDQTDAIWKRAVRALTAEKDKLVSSKEFNTIYSELSQTTDTDKRKKLVASGQNLINEYQGKVISMVQRLNSVYKGSLDRKKMAAVIQLLNFNTSPIYQSGTQYSSGIASDAFYEGRESAISTMNALGVTGTSDLSIFGYLITDDEGKSVMKYSSPVAIMDMKNAWLGAGDVDQANIEAKLKTDGIKTTDMWNGFYSAKAKGASALKQYKSAWNAKVVKSLAPYISERGVESTLKNSATRDLLEKYIFVDNPYQVKAYLKKIFGNE